MRTFRGVLSLALIGLLALTHAHAADLHVHAAVAHLTDAHRHGPAFHHHDGDHHEQGDGTQMAAFDADDTVVPVRLAASAPRLLKPMVAERDGTPLLDGAAPSVVCGTRIVACAHGPPSTRQHSLRAPPAFSLL